MSNPWESIIAELAPVPHERPANGKTVADIVRETGYSESQADKLLRQRVRDGILKAVPFIENGHRKLCYVPTGKGGKS